MLGWRIKTASFLFLAGVACYPVPVSSRPPIKSSRTGLVDQPSPFVDVVRVVIHTA